MTSMGDSDESYSQDSDFDSDSLVSYAKYSSDQSIDFGTQRTAANTEETKSPQHHEFKQPNRKYLIQKQKNCTETSYEPQHTSTSTASISRLEELSRPRPQFELPMPPPPQRKSTRTTFIAFLERQEALEQSKQRSLTRNKLERDYNAKVTKLRCLKCSKEQSFDEANSGTTTCPRDGYAYTLRTFSIKSFEKRMFRSSCKKQQKIEEIRQARIMVLQKGRKKTAKSFEGRFLERMQNDIAQRKENLHQLRLNFLEDENRFDRTCR
jgi:hypothetical protein